MSGELRRQLLWLIVIRVAVLTTLVCSLVFLQLLGEGGGLREAALRPFYLLLGLGFGFSVVCYFLHRLTRWERALAYIQFVGDAFLVSAIVYWTGGLFSPFSFLYLLTILLASILLYQQGGLVTASLSFLLYGALGVLQYYEAVPRRELFAERYELIPLQTLVYYLSLHMFGFFTIAWLSSYLSEKLRRARADLDARQRQVYELQALNENIVSSLTTGLATTDGDFRLTFANSVVESMIGRSLGDLRGRTVDEIFRWPALTRERIREALRESRVHRFEERFPGAERSGGRPLHLAVAASRLTDRGGIPSGYLFLVDDLTGLKALEEEIRLKDRMAALGEMAAGLAHEIRNPLSSMTGSMQVLMRDLRLEGDQDRLMRIVLDESKRLDGVIREFLDYARPEDLKRQRWNLRTLVEETLNLFRHSSETGSGREFRIEGPAEIWGVVDGGKIRQVVWNLAKNAVKAMPDGGTLTVRVDGDERIVRLSFRDEGVGMTEEEQVRFLQPFEGASRDGVGLGLTIVYRIVRDHSGWLNIRSEKGRGTEITVYLPARGAEVGARGVAREAGAPSPAERGEHR